MARTCPICTEPNEPMGALGHTKHYRCRACGMWYSHTRKVGRRVLPAQRQEARPR